MNGVNRIVFFSIAMAMLVSITAFSQGTDGVLIDYNGATTRDASAIFQAQSTSQGVLISRMTETQRTAINVSSTRNGLLVFQTDGTSGFYYYDGTEWLLFSASDGDGYVENRTIDNASGTGQSASYDITGNAEIGGTLEVTGTLTGGGATVIKATNIEVNDLGSGNRNAFIDFQGDDTYTDYGLRLIRNNSGANASSSLTQRGTGNLSLQTVEAAAISFLTTNAERMRILADGNVGIGTTSPDQELEVIGTTRISTLSGSGDRMVYADNNGDLTISSSSIDPSSLVDGSGTVNYLARWTPDGATLGIGAAYDDGTNIGIGTTSPVAKLHVYESIQLADPTGSSLLLSRISGRGSSVVQKNVWLYRDAATSNGWTTVRVHDGLSVDGSFLTPGTDTKVWWERDIYDNIQSWGNAANTYMTINAGNVGIGTTSPAASLHITGSVATANPIETGVQIKGGANASLEITGTGTPFIDFQNDISGTDYDMRLILAADDILTVQGGNLGIGSTDASEALDVNGNVRIRGGSPTVGSVLTATSTNGTATWKKGIDNMAYMEDYTVQTINDGSTSAWVTCSDYSGYLSIQSGDAIEMNISYDYSLGSGSGIDDIKYRIFMQGVNGCGDYYSGETALWTGYDRGAVTGYAFNRMRTVPCTGDIRFALQAWTGNSDDAQNIDTVVIIAENHGQ